MSLSVTYMKKSNINSIKSLTFLLVAMLCIFACESNPPLRNQAPEMARIQEIPPKKEAIKVKSSFADFRLNYDLSSPDSVLILDSKLKEISALSITPDNRYLLSVNDEKGKVYFIDKHDGKITQQIDFGKKGDYEGVEMVNGSIYISKSNGTIYQVENPEIEQPHVNTFKNRLTSKHDVEGLGWSLKENALLLACKEKGDGPSDVRSIFLFDIITKQLKKKTLQISLPQFQDFFKNCTMPEMEKMDPGKAKFEYSNTLEKSVRSKKGLFNFSPSAIAEHPETKDLFLLSSVGKLFVIMGHDGRIKHMETLNKKLIVQPEGICFDQKGNLFISSEGKDGLGKIFCFLKK